MVLNFRTRGISQGVHKLAQTPFMLIIIIKKKIGRILIRVYSRSE
jgi:hypothetical protein